MAEEKSILEFSRKEWRNVAIGFVFVGLIVMFLTKEWKIGLGLFAVGGAYLAIFEGPKIFKILKKRNW